MAKRLAQVVLLLLLLSIVQLYSLESTWKLRTSQTPALRSLSSPVYFEFRKQSASNGQGAIGYLTITACNIMTYNYLIDGSEIFLSYVSTGRATRKCVNGQIFYLRGQLDETFYFYIMYGTLLLKSAYDNMPIKFDIYSQAQAPPINGVWIITNAPNADLNDQIVVVNRSRMMFCGGTHAISYNLSNLVKINITNILVNTTCNQQVLGGLNNSAFTYRVNNLVSPRTCTFFDSSVNQFMELTYNGDYPLNKIINSSSFIVSNIYNNNNTASVNNSSLLSSSSATNASQPKVRNPNKTSDSSNSINNTQNGTDTNQGSNSTTDNSLTVIIAANISQRSKNINESTVSTNKNASNSTSTQNNPSSNQKATNTNNISSTPPPSTPAYSIVAQANSVYGLWYPSPSVLPSQLKPNDIAVYQILINGAFLMLRGGCNTLISPYSFSSGSFTSTKISITANSCPVNRDSILQSIIFNASNRYYLSNGPSPSLRITSNSNITQLILTPNAPPT